MATIAQLESGTRTTAPVEGAFTSLGTDPQTTDGVFQLALDAFNMAGGDTIVIQAVEKTTGTGDTQRVVWERTYTGVQSEPLIMSPGLIFLHGWAFKLKHTVGSARDFAWSIRQITA